jgi:2-hydroxychromene-2-carboxylate isomerase
VTRRRISPPFLEFGSQFAAEGSSTPRIKVGITPQHGEVEFRFDQIRRTPNTLAAHRLIWFAGNEQIHGGRNAVVENLFRAYFIDPEDVGDLGVLKRIGGQSGLDGGRLEELFAAGIGTEELTAEENGARAHGVTGVPTFFVDGEMITSGAQKPEMLAAVLGRRRSPSIESPGTKLADLSSFSTGRECGTAGRFPPCWILSSQKSIMPGPRAHTPGWTRSVSTDQPERSTVSKTTG